MFQQKTPTLICISLQFFWWGSYSLVHLLSLPINAWSSVARQDWIPTNQRLCWFWPLGLRLIALHWAYILDLNCSDGTKIPHLRNYWEKSWYQHFHQDFYYNVNVPSLLLLVAVTTRGSTVCLYHNTWRYIIQLSYNRSPSYCGFNLSNVFFT